MGFSRPGWCHPLLSTSAILFGLIAGCSPKLGQLYSPQAHQPSPEAASVFDSQTPEEIFSEAIERREAGDLDGATQRLVWLMNAGDTSAATLYQLGVTYEADQGLDMALRVYDLLLSDSKDPGTRRDTSFRRAQVLESLGREHEALRQLRAISPPEDGFDAKDQTTFDVQLAVVRANLGRRGAMDDLRDALDAAAKRSDVSYIHAKGLENHVSLGLAHSNSLQIDGSERRVKNHAEIRAAAILAAENAIEEELIPLAEPHWTLLAMLALGDAYVAFARDLVAAPIPRHLTDAQAAIYVDMVAERATTLRRKAWSRYDSGLTYAGNLGVSNETTQILRARLEATLPISPTP